MDTFEIFTIGNAYFLDKIFNAIKIIFSSGLTGVLKITISISLALLAIKAMTTSNFKEAIKWMASIIVLMGLFLTTKARLVIHDGLPDQYHRIQAPFIVEDVPWGLAWIAYATSSVGKVMITKFEMAFSGVTNNQTYRKYGILFGSKVIEEANRVNIRNPDLKGNMLKFYRQCIVPDLKMGNNRNNGYTLRELSQTEDIGSFLKDHASRARNIYLTAEFSTKEEGTNTSKNLFANMFSKATTTRTSGSIDGYVSCNKAAHVINDMIEREVDANKNFYSSTFISQFMGKNDTTSVRNKFFEAVLKDTYGAFLKSSKEASDILKQNIMINSLSDSSKNISSSYARSVSDEMTRSSMYSVSQIFQKFIPVIRSVFECLFYGVFPIIVILLVTPIGLEVLKNYTFSFLYLQMWPPMYAILYVITESWTRMSAGNLKHNMEALPQIEAINYDISMVSGYMLAFIPIISLYITRGLVASIGNMANSMMYIPQAAAVTTSDQAVKGNYTLGNTSLDNSSYDNTSAHKHDTNFSILSGMKTFQQPTGSIIKESPSGSMIMDLSGSSHNLAGLASINWHQVIGTRYDESESIAKRQMKVASKDYVDSISSGMNKVLGFDSSYSKGTLANELINKSMSYNEKKAADYVTGVTNRIAKEHGISSADTFNMALAARAGLDISMGTESRKTEAWNAVKSASKEQRFSESLSLLENYGKTISMGQNAQESDSVIDSMKSDFNKSMSASARINIAQENLQSIQESRSNYKNNSHSIDIGLNNQFADWGGQKYGASNFEEMLINNPSKIRVLAKGFLDDKGYGTGPYKFTENKEQNFNLNEKDEALISTNKTSNDDFIDYQSYDLVKDKKDHQYNLKLSYGKEEQDFDHRSLLQENRLQYQKENINDENTARESEGAKKIDQLAIQQFKGRIIGKHTNNAAKEKHDFFKDK